MEGKVGERREGRGGEANEKEEDKEEEEEEQSAVGERNDEEEEEEEGVGGKNPPSLSPPFSPLLVTPLRRGEYVISKRRISSRKS